MVRSYKCLIHRYLISIIFLLILTGGVFVNSALFKEVENTPKEYFILISLTSLLIVCLVSSNCLRQLKKSVTISFFLNGITVVCFLTTIHGLLQFFGLITSHHSAFPITGTFDNPAGFAAVQTALFPFVFNSCFDKENGKFLHFFSISVVVLCFISVVLSGSRAGFLALCTSIIVILAYDETIVALFKSHRWLWLPLLLLVVLSSIMLYLLKQDSADGRLFIWSRCLEIIKERPLLGYGMSGFRQYYMSAQANYFRANPGSSFIMLSDNVGHPFNEYIRLIIQFGLVGFLIAVIILVIIVRKLLKCDKPTKVLGLSFVSSIFVMCQFSYPFRYAAVWLLASFAIIPAFINKGNKTYLIPAYIRIMLSCSLLIFLAGTLRRMYYEMKWSEISERAVVGQSKKMLKYYSEMKHVMSHDPLFLYNYAAELNYNGQYLESIEIVKQCARMWNDYDVQILLANNYAYLKDKDSAIQSYEQAYNMIPCRFEPLYGEMLVYMESNDTLNVIRVADIINEKPVKVRSDRVSFIVQRAQQAIIDYDHY